MRLGKNQKTMKQLGLEGWLGVEFYDLGPEACNFAFSCASHKMPVFLDLNMRTVADGYSPGDKRVYVFGRGFTASLVALDKQIARLQSQHDLATNADEKARVKEKMAQLSLTKKQKRRRFYTSAAQFLVGVFDFVAVSDLSAAALKKQPNIAKRLARVQSAAWETLQLKSSGVWC